MILNKIYLKLPIKLREKLLVFFNNKGIKDIKLKNKRMLDFYSKDLYSSNWGKYIDQKKTWYKAYLDLSKRTKDGIDEAEYFYLDKINLININEEKVDYKIILICLVKNDLERMKLFMNHYRKLGIKKFAIIDNDSTDGTFEFLREQKDVDLFQAKEKYSTIRRQSWINRIISYYGLNRWYLIVDSDELLVYNDMESYKIERLLEYFSKKGVERCKALMVDMYPEKFMMENDLVDDYFSLFKYFDTDTYYEVRNKYFEQISGGMRERVFGKDDTNFRIFLVKYPLIYFREGDIQYNSHYSYPFYKNFNKTLNLSLLHYKFLPKDLKRIEEIVKNKNFASGSKEYKKYLEIYKRDKDIKLVYENSGEFSTSNSVYDIDKLKKIEW